jgi:hypothetical protein
MSEGGAVLFENSRCDPHRKQATNDHSQDMLIFKRASASRPSGQWSDEDFDVLANGIVVGRIFKADTAPVGEPWMWPLDAAPLIRIHGQHPTGALRPHY